MSAQPQPKVDISIDALARLARVSLTAGEKEVFGRQLGDILGYVTKLNELDTENIAPTSHVLSLENVTREDIPGACLDREDALANAPDHSDKFYRVAKIIE